MLNHELARRYLHPLEPQPTSLDPGGTLPRKVAGILFDVYGTLFISASGDIGAHAAAHRKSDALQALLRKFGCATDADAVMADFYAAIKARHTALRQRGVPYPEVRIDRIWMSVLNLSNVVDARDFALEYELIINPVYPMPHLAATLAHLKQAPVTMGLISNAQFYTPLLFNWFLDADIETLGFEKDLIIMSYRFETAKPATHLYEIAARRLRQADVDPRRVLYVGNDMLNDILPARKCGFMTALFAGDARSLRLRADDPRCHDLAPDIVVTDLVQLIDYIKP